MADWTKFDGFAHHLGNKEIDLDTDTFYVMLTTAGATSSWNDRADVTNEVTSGCTSYPTDGGKTIGTPTWSAAGVWDSPDVVWAQDAASSVTDALCAIIYLHTGTEANDILCWYATFAAAKSLVDGSLTLEIANIFTSA